MSAMTEVSSLTGRLLVATPALADPNFDRAVVLVLDHDGEGSLGVVLNRPTPVDVGDILAGWDQLTGEPGVIFQGGPVSLDSALGVAVIPGGSGPAVPGIDEPTPRRRPWGDASEGLRRRSDRDDPIGWRRVYGAIGLVDLETPPELLAAALGSLRIFAGYAGWGPGQLAAEVEAGAWYVVDSEPGDVSSPDPDGLWRSVLRRQRSMLAMIATYPDDPSLN
ncbi:YqgE/AlgH family protein [Streptomyces sp. NBC_01387]|uniref:YqgE/AlgH family protein n=1 Tax=unclassified Streptomyces TaxID=2593676 RepID=UPI002024069E|nr:MULTISPECIES: YqgE/AlgH family protein [unclassified Streptomyces]MCX4550785.1 YqgE/AlgH family protein [Streptomyces sp. NBC_01500]WSC22216.1 YqgE/AlgH family protein [Streptomyces sp. NBC_01766]WSV56063.1 YqgE/AlgH family protein [Streptomyces sp. NBC_01014]